MEGSDTVAIETAQPRPAGSPVLDEHESNGVDEKASPNGSMSVSTESEGFQDDKGEEEAPVEEVDEVIEPQPKPVEKKAASQKSESPTKSTKSKKKEDKSIEHILKALSSLQSTEEKLAALCKKYADLHEDHRILQASFKQSQRKVTVVTREKDQLQTEHTKAVMAKSKLESLCRELQKHNQTIRQESLQRAKEEDEKRKEISQKFQTTIGEIQTQMQENHERNKQLREENYDLANKLKKFIEQYEVREKQVEKVIQHRELEQKLADAKLEQASAILMEEQGRNQKEKEMLIIQATEYMKKMQLKEAELNMYKERYEEFQTTIKRSEEMFTKFKTEMDKMSKRCKKVEKEGASWKSKWDNANKALLAMAEEKTKYDKERPLLVGKIQKLESLCRAMQAERKARNILEAEGVDLSKLSLNPEATSLSPTPADPTPSPGDSTPSPDNSSPSPVEGGACGGGGADTGSGEECKDDEDDGSDHSSASGETGVTVIKQGPDESNQSQPSTQTDSGQPGDTTQEPVEAENQSENAS